MKGLFAFLAMLLLLAACTPQQQSEEIKIGAVLPLTGTAAPYGENARQGIDLAVKEINAAGGINDRQIEIIYEDDATDPAKSLTATKKLIEVDEAQIIIGGVWDFLANAIIPEIDQKKTLLISPSALIDTITQTSPYFFVAHSPVALNHKIFEEYLEQLPNKTVAAIVINNPWGLAHLETLKKAISATNSKLVDERIVQNFDGNDISTELTLINKHKPDAIFAALNFNDMAMLAKKRKELNIHSAVLAHENFAGSVADGRIPISQSENVTIYKYGEPSQEFIDKFFKEYGKHPAFVGDIAYDIVYALKYAIEKHDESAEGVRAGLHEIEFDGASGHIYFGPNNYPSNKKPVLMKFSGGKLVEVDLS